MVPCLRTSRLPTSGACGKINWTTVFYCTNWTEHPSLTLTLSACANAFHFSPQLETWYVPWAITTNWYWNDFVICCRISGSSECLHRCNCDVVKRVMPALNHCMLTLLLLLLCPRRRWCNDLPRGTCVLVSSSVDHDNVQLEAGIRAVLLTSRIIIEPCGPGRSRLTHYCRADLRWATKQAQPIQTNKQMPETKKL